MHVFTVFAHPNRDSLAGGLLDRFVTGLELAGHTNDLSDLYREKFNPVFNSNDFDFFRERGDMPEEIHAIHQRIDKARVLAFVFPVWWWSTPAILKGWFDRVLINDFAYTLHGHDIVPALSDKKVIMICPAGSSAHTYQKYGYDTVIQRQIDAGIWIYCGLTDIETYIMPDIDASDEARNRHLDDAEQIGRLLC